MRVRVLSLICLVALAMLACVPAFAEGPVDIQILQPLPGYPITGNQLPLAVTFRNPADAQGVYFDSYLDGKQLLFGNIRYPTANTSTFHFRKDVDVSAFGLLPGPHKLVVMLRDNRNRMSRAEVDVTVQAAVNVRESVPPSVRILAPLNGDSVVGATQIRVEATDASGINFVTILVNGQVYGVTNEAPYALAWDPLKLKLPEGDYTITAIALDLWENRASSETIRVRFTNGGHTWAPLNVPTTYATTAARPGATPSISPTVLGGSQPTVRATAYANLPALLLPTAGRTDAYPRFNGALMALLPSRMAPVTAMQPGMAPLGAVGFATGPALASAGMTTAPWTQFASMSPLRTPLLAPPAEAAPPTRVAIDVQPAVRIAMAPTSRLPVSYAGLSDVSAALLTMPTGYSRFLSPFAPTAQIAFLEPHLITPRTVLAVNGDAIASRADMAVAPVRIAMAPTTRLPVSYAGLSDVSAALLTMPTGYSRFLSPFAPTAQIAFLEPHLITPRTALAVNGDAIASRADMAVAPVRIALMPPAGKALPMDAGILVYPVYDVPVTMLTAPVYPSAVAGMPNYADPAAVARGSASVTMPALPDHGARGVVQETPEAVLVARLPGQTPPAGLAETATVDLLGAAAPLAPTAGIADPVATGVSAPKLVRGMPGVCDVTAAGGAAGLPTSVPTPGTVVGTEKPTPDAALIDRANRTVVYVAALPSPKPIASAPVTPSAAPSTDTGSTAVELDALVRYTARSGDTVEMIAVAHGTTAEQLLQLNPGLSPTRLPAGTNVIVPAAGSARVYLDAQPLTGAGETYPEPYIVNGCSMVPVRLLVEAKGGVVVWVAKTQEVNAWVKDTYIGMRIGDRTARVNGEVIQMPLAAAMRDERAMVPMRFLATALKLDVEYNPASGTYALVSNNQP